MIYARGILRCHPDRVTITSNNNTLFSRIPRACSSDQPRVMVGLLVWSVTPSPPTKSLDFRGFDSSKLLILRGGNSDVR